MKRKAPAPSALPAEQAHALPSRRQVKQARKQHRATVHDTIHELARNVGVLIDGMGATCALCNERSIATARFSCCSPHVDGPSSAADDGWDCCVVCVRKLVSHSFDLPTARFDRVKTLEELEALTVGDALSKIKTSLHLFIYLG
jgi:hypothetical protein